MPPSTSSSITVSPRVPLRPKSLNRRRLEAVRVFGHHTIGLVLPCRRGERGSCYRRQAGNTRDQNGVWLFCRATRTSPTGLSNQESTWIRCSYPQLVIWPSICMTGRGMEPLEGDEVLQAPVIDGEVGRMKEHDRRRLPRTQANCLVEISFLQDHRQRRCQGILTELSPDGGLLKFDEASSVGSRLTLRIWLQDLSVVVCTGIVRSRHEGQCVGIEFADLSPQDLTLLKATPSIRRSLEA